MDPLETFFPAAAELVNTEIDRLIPDKGEAPQKLRDAMRWSLFAGGKRFRPALLFATGRAFGAADAELLRTAAAVEMIHTYSLIHDDLPAMDNDDLRRGRPTCHKRFGEATAILAGDALQALAFQTIAEDSGLSAAVRGELVSGLGRAAAAMVAGQHLDLEAEGRTVAVEELEAIHRSKTGALITFAVDGGARIGNASPDERRMMDDFAVKIGLLYQITDDILDVTQSTETLGKTAAKDIASEKATYPVVIGLERSSELIAHIHGEAVGVLKTLDRPVGLLQEIADFLLTRKY
jgi:geranylgeranyl pyrophosphate synthase